ncbi:Transcription factor Dp-1 [Seminavis robusta]|uniref:Transcription factor Dp-1 n=1 Tax=Seminavis robusta TaxID=568900 RepID=A0A9N8HK18_9STRA|nr:Transcription factor Dp-1 [Seminavis robusta]|eukprot:Sro905_g218570.1 Transcription factor Dp-1 (446) ;mRNA; r:32709-34148
MQETNNIPEDSGVGATENAAGDEGKRAAENPPPGDEPPKKKPALSSSPMDTGEPIDLSLMDKNDAAKQTPNEKAKDSSTPVATVEPSDPSKSTPPSSQGTPNNETAERTTRSSERATRSATAANTKGATTVETSDNKQPRRSSTAQAKTTSTSTGKSKESAAATTPTGTAGAKSSGKSATTGTNSSASKKTATTEQVPKVLKGLRHFSMMVCKKVEEKGQTTYNEVADELVKQVIESRKKEDPQGKFDEKNIRRRVYDSINVLLAMDIISKDKKDISWKGLPTMAHHDIEVLEREEEARKEQVQAKRRALQELLVQQICFRNLVRHNKQREMETLHAEKVPLPFILVNTNKEAVIHCNMAPDLHSVNFEFDRPFEINDDNSILTRLGMHRTTIPDLKQMVPEDLVTYCQEHGLLEDVLSGDGDDDNPLALTSVGSNRGQYFQSLD